MVDIRDPRTNIGGSLLVSLELLAEPP